MGIEKRRGCGFRKLYRLYLVGTGLAVPCDRLPFELRECPCCGFVPKQIRGFTWIHKLWLEGGMVDHLADCTCFETCPVCHPDLIHADRLKKGTHFGLMWTGKRWYTPRSFTLEAREMGVCKAISQMPKGLVLGKTWVLVAHPKCEFYEHGFLDEGGLAKSAPRKGPGIFYAFVPQRVEVLVPEDISEEKAAAYEEQGITLIRVPLDKLEDHK